MQLGGRGGVRLLPNLNMSSEPFLSVLDQLPIVCDGTWCLLGNIDDRGLAMQVKGDKY